MSALDGPLPPHQPHCMGCGDQNPASFGLRMRRDGERIRAEVTFDRRQEGAPGFAHGGAVSAALDDCLGSVLVILRIPAVTARLEVDFRHPALLGRRLEIEAWPEGVEGRKLSLAATMRDEGGLIAEARAIFVQVELQHFLQGTAELPESWREEAKRAGFEFP